MPALKPPSQEKICYTISEVAAMYGLSEVTLRYWEREGALKPRRNGGSGATRYYHPEHLKIIGRLQHLIYNKGLSLKAAKKLLRSGERNHELEAVERLQSIREHLALLYSNCQALLDSMPDTTEKGRP